MHKKMIASVCAAVLLAAGTAKAELLAYEGFDGLPAGQTTTFGFYDTFNAPGSSGGAGYATTASLSYGGLVTNGVARQAPAGGWDLERATLGSTIDSGTVWMSWLYRTDAGISQWTRLLTFNAANPALPEATEHTNLGLVGDRFTIRPLDAGWAVSGLIPQANTTYMLVAKYDFAAGKISMWINPDTTKLGTGTEPTVGIGGDLITKEGMSTQMVFNRISMEGGTAAAFDELRIGTTWADVSPVPEPATMALLGISVVGLGMRRRHA